MYVQTYLLSQLRKLLILLIESHCKICPLPTGLSRVFVLLAIVSNASMFKHTRSSAPKRLSKFGWQIPTFCHKKMEKAVAELESDRLYIARNTCWHYG